MSKLAKVGLCRMSRDGKTLVMTITDSFGPKVYLMWAEDVLDLTGGYKDSVNIVEGKVLESIQNK